MYVEFQVLSNLRASPASEISDLFELMPCDLIFIFTALIVNQESLWRHGVVHDPAKKKMKVLCTR